MVSTAELPFITKTLIPKGRDYIVRRERILRPMLSSVDRKVQVVCAPAGYGKTALLTEFAAEAGPSLCWYSFSPEDRDPISFLRHCVHSVHAIDSGFGAGIISLLRGNANPDQTSLVGMFTTALHSELSGRLVFVFDDVHWIDGKRDLEEGLSLLIERAPPNVHFVLASRMWPALSCLPKLAASDEVSSFNVQDFRFSTEETAHLLTKLWNSPASLEQAQEINDRTRGWVAGIMLTAKSTTASASLDIGDLGEQGILFDYLSAEIFDKLPKPLRSFLLRTSILLDFSSAFCDDLLGLSSSEQLIDQIKDRSLFLEERAGRNPTYAYHDLFRDHLERRFRLEFHSEYQQISRRAADLYREVGDDDSAIYHYLQCGDVGQVVEIVKQCSGSYFDQGSWSKLASWLDGLPAHVVESDSELLLLHGRILTMKVGDPTGALEQFDKLLARRHAENPEVVGKALVAISTAYRRLGHLDLAVKAARDGLAILLEVECPQGHLAEAHRQLASALATQGELNLGKNHFKAALKLARGENLSLFSLICDGMAVACMEQGELDQAGVYLEQARTGWLKLGSEGPLAESLINLALVYYHQGEFGLAFEEAAEALQAAEASGYPRLVATALGGLAIIRRALGAYEDSAFSASRALELARELLDQRLVFESTNDLGNAYRKLGETYKAEVLLSQAILEAEQSGQKYMVAIYHISLGKLYFQQGLYNQASNHLATAEVQLTGLNSSGRAAEVSLYQAAISYRRGDPKDALESLDQVSRLVLELGYDGFLLADGVDVLDVVRFGSARRVGGETFTRLAARLTHVDASDEESESTSPGNGDFIHFPELRAVGFGNPRVVLGFHAVSDAEWRSRKAKELFFFLLCNKRPMSNEEILDAVWPDTSLHLSDSALKTSVYRLRQAVFYECILAQEAGYRINSAVEIQFDIDDFEQHLRLASRLTKSDQAREEHLQKAIELYDGPFLNGVYSEWCQRIRTNLELQFHTALMNLADYHAAKGNFLRSAELLEKAVQSDPYDEMARFGLIENYLEANEPLVALQHLRRYARICREELGVQLPQRFAHCHDRIISELPRNP